MAMYHFQNLIFVRSDNFDAISDLQKQQILKVFNLASLPFEAACEKAKVELNEFPCEWWQVVATHQPEIPLYDFVIAYEDGRAFIAGTLKEAKIYVSQNTIQFDDDSDAEQALQKAYYKRKRPDYTRR